ncbi:MAG: agglutinin biogenesis protein MshI [Rhodocyclaceae bacterium]|jgi:MSHA biogenesis protein MshI|nr:agglutinin biogenesis protein MshI [Rhodocyclaceae bacterium]
MKAFLPGGQNSKGWMAISLYPERIDIARVKRNGDGRPEVAMLDSYRKEGGDKESLARLRKSLRLGNHRCATLLRPAEYQMLQIEAPAVPPDEIREAVRWRIKDMLDYPPTAATIDVLNVPGEGAGKSRQVFVVAANNALIGPRMQMFEDAKVPLEAIDIQETAQRNIAALYEVENRGLALLSFDENGGLLTFTFKGELYLARRIEITASQMAEADGERRRQLFERIGLELQRSLDHFDRQFSFIPLAKLVVAPVAEVPGLIEYLGGNLYVPMESLDLARVMDFPAVPELRNAARQAQCLHTIGIALRDEGAGQ